MLSYSANMSFFRTKPERGGEGGKEEEAAIGREQRSTVHKDLPTLLQWRGGGGGGGGDPRHLETYRQAFTAVGKDQLLIYSEDKDIKGSGPGHHCAQSMLNGFILAAILKSFISS